MFQVFFWGTQFKTGYMKTSSTPNHCPQGVKITMFQTKWRLLGNVFYFKPEASLTWYTCAHTRPTPCSSWGLSQHLTGYVSNSCVWLITVGILGETIEEITCFWATTKLWEFSWTGRCTKAMALNTPLIKHRPKHTEHCVNFLMMH